MKTQSQPKANKLITRFDTELKNLLLEDLKTVKQTRQQIIDKIAQSVTSNQLSAA